jgi:hypothetical protein
MTAASRLTRGPLLRWGLDSVLAGLDSGREPASDAPFLPISNMMIP